MSARVDRDVIFYYLFICTVTEPQYSVQCKPVQDYSMYILRSISNSIHFQGNISAPLIKQDVHFQPCITQYMKELYV